MFADIRVPGVGHLKFYYCPGAGYLSTHVTTPVFGSHVGFGDSHAAENPNKMLLSSMFHLLLITYGSNEIRPIQWAIPENIRTYTTDGF